jgi:hypothetical protein
MPKADATGLAPKKSAADPLWQRVLLLGFDFADFFGEVSE